MSKPIKTVFDFFIQNVKKGNIVMWSTLFAIQFNKYLLTEMHSVVLGKPVILVHVWMRQSI